LDVPRASRRAYIAMRPSQPESGHGSSGYRPARDRERVDLGVVSKITSSHSSLPAPPPSTRVSNAARTRSDVIDASVSNMSSVQGRQGVHTNNEYLGTVVLVTIPKARTERCPNRDTRLPSTRRTRHLEHHTGRNGSGGRHDGARLALELETWWLEVTRTRGCKVYDQAVEAGAQRRETRAVR
jgi:hypothetical protein